MLEEKENIYQKYVDSNLVDPIIFGYYFVMSVASEVKIAYLRTQINVQVMRFWVIGIEGSWPKLLNTICWLVMFQRTCSLSRAFMVLVVSAGCIYMCSSVINSTFNVVATVVNVHERDHFCSQVFFLWKIILPWTRSVPFSHWLLALFFIFSCVHVYVVFSCLYKKTGTGLKRGKSFSKLQKGFGY